MDHQTAVGLAWLFLSGNHTNKIPEYFITCFSPPLLLAPIRTSSPDQKPAALPVHRESMVTLLGLIQAGMGQEGDGCENGFSFDTHQLQIKVPIQHSIAWAGLSRCQELFCCHHQAAAVSTWHFHQTSSPCPPHCTNSNIYYREKYLQCSFPSWHSTKGHT